MLKERSIFSIIHFLIMISIVVVFWNLPEYKGITDLGMNTLGIFFALIYGWSTLGFTWVSLLAIIAFGFLPGNTVMGSLTSAFGDKIVIPVMFIMVFAAIIDGVGLSQYIANWCTSRKFAQGRPWVLAAMFCLAAGLISMVLNWMAGVIIVFAIFKRFCDMYDLKPGDRYPMIVTANIVYGSALWSNIFPFNGLSYVTTMLLRTYMPDTVINYPIYIILQLIFGVVSQLLFTVCMIILFRPDVSFIQKKEIALETFQEKLNSAQKQALGLMILLVFLLCSSSIFPKDWTFTKLCQQLDIAGTVVFIVVLYFILNLGKKEAISFGQMAKSINWDVVLMFATIGPMTTAFSADEAGVIKFITVQIGTFVEGLSPTVFLLGVLLIALIVTQFMNNTVIVLIFLPIIYSFVGSFGLNPMAVTLISAYCLNIAFCTPAASGPAVMLYSSEYIKKKEAFFIGMLLFVITLLITALGLPIVNLVYN